MNKNLTTEEKDWLKGQLTTDSAQFIIGLSELKGVHIILDSDYFDILVIVPTYRLGNSSIRQGLETLLVDNCDLVIGVM